MIMKNIKLFLGTILFLLIFPIGLIYATAWDRAQTSKSGIVDMFEVLPEYLQATSTAENRDFHIKRNERSIGSGAQYYFYMEGGSLTVSMTTDGVFRIGNTILGSSTPAYPINLAGGTATTGVLPENQGGFGTSTPGYVRQNNGSSTGQTATNITIAGTGTDTATMRIGGVDISPTEKSYLDGATSNIQTQINTLGTSTPTANSIVRTESGTTTIGSGWIPNTIILNNLTQITTRNYDDLSGTSTIKPTQIAIGTATLQGALNAVGTATFSGTVTAGGFSGNGAGLTGIAVALSNATGSATATQLPLISGLLGSATALQLPLLSGISGSATAAQLPADPTMSGTITASGFSGNGAGLTNISATVAFSGVTGLPTDNNNFQTVAGTSTVPVRDSDGNLFASGIIGGTTTGALRLPIGTGTARPGSASVGMIRVNTPMGILGSGGSITTWGTYTIHTFTSSGSFVAPSIKQDLEVYLGGSWLTIKSGTATTNNAIEILVVAGGGASGNNSGGGGGGGGVVATSTSTLTGGSNYTVTIGAGGAAASPGGNGSNSVFDTITATGGGGGGGDSGSTAGQVGGSGGGAVYSNPTAFGTGTAGQGYRGGTSTAAFQASGGGGGGGGAGQNAPSSLVAGDGGIGYLSSISGSSTYYAGGGGGGGWGAFTLGNGGLGGGGTGTAGTANTGGGGGGTSAGGTPGGSGIVIVRYPTP